MACDECGRLICDYCGRSEDDVDYEKWMQLHSCKYEQIFYWHFCSEDCLARWSDKRMRETYAKK